MNSSSIPNRTAIDPKIAASVGNTIKRDEQHHPRHRGQGREGAAAVLIDDVLLQERVAAHVREPAERAEPYRQGDRPREVRHRGQQDQHDPGRAQRPDRDAVALDQASHLSGRRESRARARRRRRSPPVPTRSFSPQGVLDEDRHDRQHRPDRPRTRSPARPSSRTRSSPPAGTGSRRGRRGTRG